MATGNAPFRGRQRMALGQIKVGEKSNEIVAIPALLGLLAIEGAVVMIDAMGRQRGIAQKIIDKKADSIALKGGRRSEMAPHLLEKMEFGLENGAFGPGADMRLRHQPRAGPEGSLPS